MKYKITCLGVGNGSSYALRGNPSSSFLISKNDEPYILVDCGLGINLQYQKLIGSKPPKYVFITHNHIDHSGEIAILLFDHYKKSHKPIILSHSEVLEMVQKYRLHELYYVGIELKNLAVWKNENDLNSIQLEGDETVELMKSVHSYPCYGFRLKTKNETIIGYSADSGFDQKVLDFVTEAKVAILDARAKGNNEHSSVTQIEKYCQNLKKKVYIIHHENEDIKLKSKNLTYLKEGLEINV